MFLQIYEFKRFILYNLSHELICTKKYFFACLFKVSLPLEMTHGTVRTQIVALAGKLFFSPLKVTGGFPYNKSGPQRFSEENILLILIFV